jgi:hypothetical protein
MSADIPLGDHCNRSEKKGKLMGWRSRDKEQSKLGGWETCENINPALLCSSLICNYIILAKMLTTLPSFYVTFHTYLSSKTLFRMCVVLPHVILSCGFL